MLRRCGTDLSAWVGLSLTQVSLVFSLSPDNVKNILEGNALTNVLLFFFFLMTPSEENFKKRRRVARTFTLPVRGRRLISEKMKKRRVAKLTEKLH